MSYKIIALLSDVVFGLFLILPLALLFARNRWKPKFHTVWLFLGFVVLGGLLHILRVELYFDSLERQVAATPNPSDELLDNLQSDAALAFAPLLGWAFAAVYFAIWFVLFRVGQLVWKELRPG